MAQPITLKLVIKGTIPSKKNNKQLGVNKAGKPYSTTSARFKQWHKQHHYQVTEWLYKQVERYPDLEVPMLKKIKMKVLFYFGDDKDRDLSNKLETIQDLLTDTGVIYNDSYRVLAIEADGKYVKGHTRTEIYLTFPHLANDPELVALMERRKKKREQRRLAKLKKIPVFTFLTDELA
jgi:Holliday junction resolvase RusA-like endonuclease